MYDLGKGVDHTKVVIWDDMLVIRGERFLTEPERYIVEIPAGKEVVRARGCRLPNSIRLTRFLRRF